MRNQDPELEDGLRKWPIWCISRVRDVAHVPFSDVLSWRTGFIDVGPFHSDWWWVRLTARVFISQLCPCISMKLSICNI